jgi:hypothetical protein
METLFHPLYQLKFGRNSTLSVSTTRESLVPPAEQLSEWPLTKESVSNIPAQPAIDYGMLLTDDQSFASLSHTRTIQ